MDVQTAQGRAWNYVSAEQMGSAPQVIEGIVVNSNGRLIVVNWPQAVHLRSNGYVITVKAYDPSNTVTLDYKRGDHMVAVITDSTTVGIRTQNLGDYAPSGLSTLHECALNNR